MNIKLSKSATLKTGLTASLLLGGALLTTPRAAAAENAEKLHLPDMVVTATRSAQSANIIGSSITVITAEQISQLQVNTVLDALRLVPGVQIRQQGGPGRQTSVFIRGHNSNHTLVLIDGVRVNSNSNGGYDLSNLTVNNIEKIEILSGPQSAVYGSDAIAGVVNIVTKRGTEDFQGNVKGALGTGGYRSGGLSLSGGNSAGDFSIGYTGTRFKGSSAASEKLGNMQDDEWISHAFSGRFGAHFLEDGRAELTINHSRDFTELDGFVGGNLVDAPNAYQRRNSLATKLSLTKPILDWYTQEFSFGLAYEKVKGRDRDGIGAVYDLTNESRTFSSKSDFIISERNTLSLGYDFEDQSGKNPASAINKSVKLHSWYAQNHWVYEDIAGITAGIRHDDHETFGGKTTFRLAGSYKIPAAGTRIYGSFGTGFRAPTLNDLYWPITAFALGNPNLSPETSKGFDIGIEQNLFKETVIADITYFRSKVKDLIDWAATGPNWWDPWMPQNIAEAKIQGVETSLKWYPSKDLELALGYTYTDAENAGTGNKLARRAEHHYWSRTTYRISEKGSVTLSATRTGKAYDNAANTQSLSDYTKVDLSFDYRLSDNLRIFGRIDNLFDKPYEEVRNYGIAGRYAFAGISLDF